MARKTEYLQERVKVDDDGRSNAMARDCYNKPEWFWWIDIIHLGVPFCPTPRHSHPPIKWQQMVPQAALHPPAHPLPAAVPQAISIDNLPIHRHTTTSNIPNQPVS
ncbi:hypothetical protein FRC02_006940 [Tulasnella sp. 418]|nr:hypothetical protein FRC02_006940 [Tulasnella sp. 418]